MVIVANYYVPGYSKYLNGLQLELMIKLVGTSSWRLQVKNRIFFQNELRLKSFQDSFRQKLKRKRQGFEMSFLK